MDTVDDLAKRVADVIARSRQACRDIEKAREVLRLCLPGDDVELPFRRAICHPILGGTLRRDERHDIPGPSFTVNSLRRAAEKGELRTSWHGANQFTCAAALREWVATRTSSTSGRKANPVTRTPAAQTHHEKMQAKASVASASAKLIAMKATLAKKKGK